MKTAIRRINEKAPPVRPEGRTAGSNESRAYQSIEAAREPAEAWVHLLAIGICRLGARTAGSDRRAP
jgi:hypothetical protein